MSDDVEASARPAEWRAALTETLKRSAVALKQCGVPFALGGGHAVYARGGPASEHDVDFLVREDDAEEAIEALMAAGLRGEHPPEDWLLKAYDEDRLVDVIWRLGGRPVDDDLLARAEELDVCSVMMPVVGATDLVIGKLLPLTAHYCDLSGPLALARALREQVDWRLVRDETAESPYAAAFLLLGERLGVVPPAVAGSSDASDSADRTGDVACRMSTVPIGDDTSSKRSSKTPGSASWASA